MESTRTPLASGRLSQLFRHHLRGDHLKRLSPVHMCGASCLIQPSGTGFPADTVAAAGGGLNCFPGWRESRSLQSQASRACCTLGLEEKKGTLKVMQQTLLHPRASSDPWGGVATRSKTSIHRPWLILPCFREVRRVWGFLGKWRGSGKRLELSPPLSHFSRLRIHLSGRVTLDPLVIPHVAQ